MTDFDFPSLTPLLVPGSVAVIGASDDPKRIGGRPISYMLQRNFAGAILPVNKGRDTVQGLPSYRTIADLPMAPDVAIVAVPSADAVDAMEALAQRGTKSAIVLSSGFAETGPEGAVEQQRLVAAARDGGMRMIGPNCLGLANSRIGYFPTFTSSFETGWPEAGRIAVASQSGAYGTHMMAVFRNRGIGASIFVSTGNEADVSVADVIGWLADDPETDVIAAYIEGVRDGDRLIAALSAAHKARKPVVMMKVGRSEAGGAAARSHTGSLAGNDAIFDAVLADFAVVRARTTEEMIDIAYAATRRIYPVNNSLGLLTISGGAGVIVSDAAVAAGLAMPEMPADAQARLKKLIPFAAPANPVDCTAQVLNDMKQVGSFADEMVEAGGYRSILAFFTMVGAAASYVAPLRAALGATKDKNPDRLYVLSIVASAELTKTYEEDGFLVMEDPSRAVAAIAAMGRFGDGFARALPVVSAPRAIELPAKTPNEADAKRLLASVGIDPVPERLCATPKAAVEAASALGYPVVMKIASPAILHKTEIGGVLLGVSGEEAVRAGFSTLIEQATRAVPGAPIDGVIVAKQMAGGVECVMGIERDPVFGPVAMFGLGGIFVEVLGDVVFRRCPFDEAAALDMIGRIRGAALLAGARGRPAADLKALARMLSRLSHFAHDAGPRLKSVDINPVFALPEGAFAADALIEIAED